MDSMNHLIERVLTAILDGAGLAALVIFLVGGFFAFLYFRERNRNRQLTDIIITNSEKHADRFVSVVTTGIEADNKLAQSISQLATTIADVKTKMDSLTGKGQTVRRR